MSAIHLAGATRLVSPLITGTVRARRVPAAHQWLRIRIMRHRRNATATRALSAMVARRGRETKKKKLHFRPPVQHRHESTRAELAHAESNDTRVAGRGPFRRSAAASYSARKRLHRFACAFISSLHGDTPASEHASATFWSEARLDPRKWRIALHMPPPPCFKNRSPESERRRAQRRATAPRSPPQFNGISAAGNRTTFRRAPP